VRLILGNDHQMFTDALADVLAQQGVMVLARAGTPDAVVLEVARHEPDICMVASRWSNAAGVDSLRLIHANHPAVSVVLLSDGSTSSDMATAVTIGAAAVVSRHQHVTDLMGVLNRVRAGERPIDTAMMVPPIGNLRPACSASDRLLDTLTVREQEVLVLLMDGQPTKEIANLLAITLHTARTHVQSVLVKLGVHSRLEATAMVARCGLLGPSGRLLVNPLAWKAAVRG
jgi:two-component system, NarL family, nitrate/nitrite response regulator NarL